MKKLNFFERNSVFKILGALILIFLSIIAYKIWPDSNLPVVTVLIGIAYVVLTVVIFTTAGIINTIKDIMKK